jgi:hypothetical protein
MDVMGRNAKCGSAVLLVAAMLMIGVHQADASQPVHPFIEYYEAVEKTNAPMNFWERVACSLMLTRTEARLPKPPVDSRNSAL